MVRTPKGFSRAYRQFREGGWTAIACDPEYGGQGLPKAVNTLVEEMICSANLSFGLYPGLTQGAYVALHDYRIGRAEADLSAEDWSTEPGPAPCA